MERETLEYLLNQLSLTLSNYHDLDKLKEDLIEYAAFMSDVYGQPDYFSDFYIIKQRFLLYLKQHHYHHQDFTCFQRHLILRCLLENYSFQELDQFVKRKIGDEEMEETYRKYFGI
ncbi:hypothetical protein [Beduini massiliensis]|uniref:hypothetical protein n=1 Tax=Beduini massiliensis TaxID=1585974 RepID=UPI00059A82F7|nr:hypothetical protein [Beduini massiliensis]